MYLLGDKNEFCIGFRQYKSNGKRVFQEVEAIPVLISASGKTSLMHRHPFFQFFKPVQNDVDFIQV